MREQVKLSVDQYNILKQIWDKQIDIENGCYDLDDLYADALAEWDMLDSDVDECINALKEFGYLDKYDNITSDGKQYLAVGYVHETVINNITINNIENQNNITANKYVERNAPAVELGSIIGGDGISIKNKESLGAGIAKELTKGFIQGVTDKLHK